MKRFAKYLPVPILLGLGYLILDKAFRGILRNPNNFLLGQSQDGLKNYFTPAWYLKYDTGLRFSGMNYPFGEHVLYTDNQPLISWLLNLWDNHVFPIADYAVGIMNGLILGAIVGCMYFLYKILRHFLMPAVYAIPVAIIIACLSPQVHRFAGHYALAYTVYIPMLWWLLIRATAGPRPGWGFAGVILAISLSGWVHAYYLLMGVLFATAYMAVFSFSQRKIRSQLTPALLKTGMSLVLPLLIFQTLMALTDSVTDRPDNPSGFFYYRAYWESVFLPVQGPLWDGWHGFFPGPRPQVEGFSYVGMLATVIGVMTIFRTIRYGWKFRYNRMLWPALPGDLAVAFWAGFLILLFSMALPFRWNLEWLLDILTPLRQFRSLGRFAWVFFYTFTVYAAVYLYLIFRRFSQKGLRVSAIWMVVIALFFWLWEAALHIKIHADVALHTKGDNVLANAEPDFGKWLADAGLKPGDFQAVLPIPSFNTGSEKFVPYPPSDATTARVYKLAFDLGLPLACGSMSRTSISESQKLIQLFSGDYIEKTILADYPNRKPLLILCESGIKLSPGEEWLMKKAVRITPEDRFALYRLELDSLATHWKAAESRFAREKDILLFAEGNLFRSRKESPVYFNGYDSGGDTAFGVSTIKGSESDPLGLFNDTIPYAEKMHVSLWMKIDPKQSGFPGFFYREYDSLGNQIDYQEIATMFGQTIYKDWMMVEYTFQLKAAGNRAEFWLKDRFPEAESFLIRPVDTDVFMEIPGKTLMYNNFYLEH
ncbi:MAG: hypothetical protein SF052_09020 [Bacteroidia bacterium]|nr:hypothetical protein [Bacteroidia bacterium]